MHPESGVKNEAGIQLLNKDPYITPGIRPRNPSRIPGAKMNPESGIPDEAGIQPLNKNPFVTPGIRFQNPSRIPGAKMEPNSEARTPDPAYIFGQGAV